MLSDAMCVCFICCGCRPVTLTPTSTLTLPFSGCSSIRFGTPCWGPSLRGKWNICAGQARWLRPPGQSLGGEKLLGRTKTSYRSPLQSGEDNYLSLMFRFQEDSFSWLWFYSGLQVLTAYLCRQNSFPLCLCFTNPFNASPSRHLLMAAF